MEHITRYRHVIDDKHCIRSPYGPNAKDLGVFVNTLVKTRIPELFRSVNGLRGHVIQLQNELNRLAKVEGLSGEEVYQAVEATKFIRASLKKAKLAAEANNFPFQLIWQPEYYI